MKEVCQLICTCSSLDLILTFFFAGGRRGPSRKAAQVALSEKGEQKELHSISETDVK
jgi:hypothetical protein